MTARRDGPVFLKVGTLVALHHGESRIFERSDVHEHSYDQ